MRALFGLFFMFLAIATPIRLLMEENLIERLDMVVVVEFIFLESIFLYFGIRLLRKKRVPQRKFYGADYGSDLDRKNENVHAYSSYNINTISYTSHNTINYTEIND